ILEGFTEVSPSGIYRESCRMIKVGGFWRTAVDMNASHVALLQTNQTTSGGKVAWAPTEDAATSYSSFLRSYLSSLLVNTSTSPATVAVNPSVDVTALEEDAEPQSLNFPPKIGISVNPAS